MMRKLLSSPDLVYSELTLVVRNDNDIATYLEQSIKRTYFMFASQMH